MTAKVLNACALNTRFWVFMAGMTNVEVTLTVADVETDAQKIYVNNQGTAFLPIQDTNGFWVFERDGVGAVTRLINWRDNNAVASCRTP